MRTDTVALMSPAPGTRHDLVVHRFGRPGARPLVYVQAGLHADELPGPLALQVLRSRLAEVEARGMVTGEVVLVPLANPVGLAQRVLGSGVGRFDLADGGNFNRGFPALADEAAAMLDGRLGSDAAANVAAVRAVLDEVAARRGAATPAEDLKRTLLRLALPADMVIDVHCDSEAVVHLYTLPASVAAFAPLAALAGARAVLTAEESGDEPFDEACSTPWHRLAARFPGVPLPVSCDACTLELRGERDVSDDLASADAAAILDALVLRGAVAGPAPQVPAAVCAPTPLAGSEPIIAPVAGIVVFRRGPGDVVSPGDVIAELVDPVDGTRTPLASRTAGVLYARASARFAHPGRRLAKIAGAEPRRTGKLLSP
jgi:predicted deacylase